MVLAVLEEMYGSAVMSLLELLSQCEEATLCLMRIGRHNGAVPLAAD